MATINNNEYGEISINNSAIEKIVVNNLLKMKYVFLPTNKRGKLIVAKGIRTKITDYIGSVEVTEYQGKLFIKIYYIIQFGESINSESNKLFDLIEADLENIGLKKPNQITSKITGVISKQIAKRELEVVRRND
ncbi:MAG: hypothetical protein JJE03_03615 [Peptostreptococcaceae bacterium]|nr:hypothetical protein [Peptostreptococcaceae bacterium]